MNKKSLLKIIISLIFIIIILFIYVNKSSIVISNDGIEKIKITAYNDSSKYSEVEIKDKLEIKELLSLVKNRLYNSILFSEVSYKAENQQREKEFCYYLEIGNEYIISLPETSSYSKTVIGKVTQGEKTIFPKISNPFILKVEELLKNE